MPALQQLPNTPAHTLPCKSRLANTLDPAFLKHPNLDSLKISSWVHFWGGLVVILAPSGMFWPAFLMSGRKIANPVWPRPIARSGPAAAFSATPSRTSSRASQNFFQSIRFAWISRCGNILLSKAYF